jgi:uncharacterized linocin/CFP29 family protein
MPEVATHSAPGPAQIDAVRVLDGSGGALSAGPVAQKLLQSNFNVNSLRTQTVLNRDEWVAFDTKVVQVAREKLVIVNDIIQRGLVYNLRNALGVMQLEWALDGDVDPAEITMSGLTQASKDTWEHGYASMPIPIIHKEFTYNLRQLVAARNNGRELDTTHGELASRKVSEKIEEMLFVGANVSMNNGRIYGLTTHPDRNTGSMTAAWASATGLQIVGDVLAGIQLAVNDFMTGPWILYVPLIASSKLDNDYQTGAGSDGRTIRERLMAIDGIVQIRTTTKLTAGFLLVQMTSDTVQMVNGMGPTMVEWETKGGFELNFKILSIMVPRIRSDRLTHSGIVHFS